MNLLRAKIGPIGSPSGLATWLILGLGIALRLVEYAGDRPLYLDESLLRASLMGRPIFELSRPLLHDQLAPPGFLIVERIASWALGGSSLALRLFPLIGSVAGLLLMRHVAARVLEGWVVPIALALYAGSDDLVYYATEIKPYSTDMAVALACLAMGLRLVRDRASAGRIAAGTLGGIAATWFSFPAAYVLAGVGSCLIARATVGRRWRSAGAWAAMSAIWGASFAACHLVSMRLLAPGPFMWVWWGFAFLPIPPTSAAQAIRVFWHVANLFTNPVGLTTPLGPIATGLLGLGLFAVGAFAMARRRPDAVFMIAAPLLLALVASGLRAYPFHGRLLYFLVPGLLVAIAQGIGTLGRRPARIPAYLLAALLLYCPAVDVLDHLARARARPFDSHGDLRNDLLDELELRELRGKFPLR